MNENEAKAIAKIIYKEMNAVVDKWTSNVALDISCCWDSCIRVGEWLFQYYELEDAP